MEAKKQEFILKLDCNTPNNLKNFLKKLGLSSSGTKKGLLYRAAEFLVTKEGYERTKEIMPRATMDELFGPDYNCEQQQQEAECHQLPKETTIQQLQETRLEQPQETCAQVSQFNGQETIKSIRYKQLNEVAKCNVRPSFIGGLDSYTVSKSPNDINLMTYEHATSIRLYNPSSNLFTQIRCICASQRFVHKPSNEESNLIECNDCGAKEHKSCVGEDNNFSGQYVCTMCRLKNLDPFSVPVTVCAGPFKVSPADPLRREFHIHNNLDEVLYNDQKKPETESIGRIYFQLRCMKLEQSSMLPKSYDNAFPKRCEVSFNNKLTNKYYTEPPPNDQKKRKDEMINLTSEVRKNKNKIELTMEDHINDQTSYICALFVVKTFSGDDIVSYINSSSKNTIKNSYDFYASKLSSNTEEDQDDDIIADKRVDFNFTCPISYCRIKQPARGSFCEHTQCFDLQNFVKSNEKWRSLKCPVCNKKVIEIKRDLIQELILYQLATEEESKCEISEEFKLKFIETDREIDLNQHLKEKLTHSNEQTVSGKTVLAPTKRSSASVEDSRNSSERNSHENPINNKYPRNEEIEHANRRSPSDLRNRHYGPRHSRKRARRDRYYDRSHYIPNQSPQNSSRFSYRHSPERRSREYNSSSYYSEFIQNPREMLIGRYKRMRLAECRDQCEHTIGLPLSIR
ncbi:unnamed protein product [Moneuplotes crassus]|uniref:Uncharacterized protein n=1 Tax=Euplotes crassus TaxID=5936 RepID=A0AAD1U667_EUPCR|nr:unnamed protein product [Moneuplotes crassus]